MGKRTIYFCDICGKETLRDDEFYDIQFTQPGEPLGAGLGYEVCETCYKKMFDHLTKISNIGKEEKDEKKQKLDIKPHCLNCKFLSRYSDPLCIGTKSPFYCRLGLGLNGDADFMADDLVCSEWQFDDSHENPAT